MPGISYDFFSPFMSAAIIVKETGNRYPLIFAEGPLPPSLQNVGLEVDCLPYLSSLVVELQLAYLPKITAVLTPTYKEAINLLNSPLVEYANNTLEVQFGYSAVGPGLGYLSPRLGGLMSQPEITLGRDTSITLHALGIGGFSGTQQTSNLPPIKEKRRKLIQKLAKGPDPVNPRPIIVNLDAIYGDSRSDNASDKGVVFARKYFEEEQEIVQAGASDWFTIWKMVREAGCWMYETGSQVTKGDVGDITSELVVIPVSSAASKNPKYKLKLYDMGVDAARSEGDLGPSAGIFPILQASSQTKAMFISGIRGLLTADIDPETRTAISKITTDKEVKLDRFGGASRTKGPSAAAPKATPETPGVNKDTGGGLQFFPMGNPNAPDVKGQITAELRGLAESMGVQLEIETLGIPDLLPADCISVEGLSARYDGKYIVMTITHTISSSGYTTRLVLRSNVQGILERFEASEKEVTATEFLNTKESNGSTTKESSSGDDSGSDTFKNDVPVGPGPRG